MNRMLLLFVLLGVSPFMFKCTNSTFEVLPENSVASEFPAISSENAGDIHNQIVLDFFQNFPGLQESLAEGNPLDITESGIINYLDNKHGTDLRNSPYYLFSNINSPLPSNARLKEETKDFDPYTILESYEGELSEHFSNKFFSLLGHTESFSDKEEHIALVINDFRKGIPLDQVLTAKEKDIFLIMLDVYQSSLELWTTVEEELDETTSANGRSKGIDRNHYWKIPVADFIQGLAGAAIAGPAAPLGALIGLAAGSITMAVGLWNSRCISIICQRRSIRVISPAAIRPVYRSTRKYNFYRINLR